MKPLRRPVQLLIVTGLSGAGKSIALRALEDSGYYCVDNLPAKLLPETVRHLVGAGQARVAVSIDTRSSALDALPGEIAGLRAEGMEVQLIYLDASTDALIKRFSETRRRHPLSNDSKTLPESIGLERDLLEVLADMGHHMDTSDLGINTLRTWIKEFTGLDHDELTLLFVSFGFKHGIPLDADFVFDVRCLPNPHYDPVLKPLTGRDAAIVDFLQKQPVVEAMYGDVARFVEQWLPCFVQDSRHYLTVAIGCTGGRHRSVYFVERLAAQFRALGRHVLVRHRGLE